MFLCQCIMLKWNKIELILMSVTSPIVIFHSLRAFVPHPRVASPASLDFEKGGVESWPRPAACERLAYVKLSRTPATADITKLEVRGRVGL